MKILFKSTLRTMLCLTLVLTLIQSHAQDLNVNGKLSIENTTALKKNSSTVMQFGPNFGSGVINYFPGRIGINTTALGTSVDLGIDGGPSTLVKLIATAQNTISFDQGSGNVGTMGMFGPTMDFRNAGGDIKFTKSGVSNVNPHIMIKNSGKIGIGTDAPSQALEVNGIININSTANTALQVDGSEAIYHNSGEYSWGFGGTRNRFADPIIIGGTTVPPSGTSLLITDSQEIKMVGDNSYIQWHAADNIDPDNANAGFVGVNQKGAMFVESNLSSVIIDGEEGIDFLVADGGLTGMTITPSKNVGIGTNTPAFKLQVAGNADITGELTAASDMRLKESIKVLEGALDKIAQLKPVTYKFKIEEFPTMQLPARKKMGFLAQEVEKVMPELVSTGTQVTDTNGNTFESKSVNYVEMIPMLTKAIQEQQAIINQLQSDVAELKGQDQNELIGQLQKEVAELKK